MPESQPKPSPPFLSMRVTSSFVLMLALIALILPVVMHAESQFGRHWYTSPGWAILPASAAADWLGRRVALRWAVIIALGAVAIMTAALRALF